MIRLFFTLLGFLLLIGLQAANLDKRLALIIPDESGNQQLERQFIKKQVNELIIQLRGERVDRKSTKKKIREITDLVNRRYLKEYSEKAELRDFFRDGRYNDLTLTLVYALLMEEFEVPWFAVVNHWDVSILADPAGKQQTLAIVGRPHNSAMERGFRAEYVEMLNLTLLPGQRPTSTEAIDSLYFKYHYAAKELLDFRQLAAYYHYERALRAYYYRDYLLAIRRLSLAGQLEKRLAFAALEQSTYLQLANLEGDDGRQSLFYLFELWSKDPENAYIPAALLTSFIEATDADLKNGEDFLASEQLYNFLESRGKNHPDWQLQLRELYYLQKTRNAAIIGRYDLVKNYVDSLYQMEPENPVFRKMTADLSLWTLRSTNATGERLRQELDTIVTRYPFARYSTGVNDLLLADVAKEIRGFYEADQGYDGDNLLLQFRSKLAATTAGKRRSMWVLTAYLSASNYYFRQGNYRQALNLIEEGLQYCPNDDYLLHRKEVLERY